MRPVMYGLALCTFAAACANGTTAATEIDAAPLPPGWVDVPPPLKAGWPRRHGEQAWDEPLWGVPVVSAPSAHDCRRPPALREVPGRPWAQRQPAHDRAGAMAPGGAAAEATDVPPTISPAPRLEHKAESAPKAAAAADALHESRRRPEEQGDSARQTARPQPAEPVTAGMVDDNADFGEYLAYLQRRGDLGLRERDVSERYRISVRDRDNRPVADAELALTWPGAAAGIVWARSDASGQAWLHPRSLVVPDVLERLLSLQVMARAPHGAGFDAAPSPIARATLQRGQKAPLLLPLRTAEPVPNRVPLDLVFLIDATGSMGDEIAKLKTSVRDIAARINRLPGQPDLCVGLVAYRDQGDEFFVRRHDLTNDIDAFQLVLGRLRAAAGGDEPEALNESLNVAVNDIAWRGPGSTRLVVLIADAPPQMHRGGPYYDQTSAAALARGIRLHAVGASGLNPQGEGVFRHLAQSTGGRFVFLTYRDAADPGSGPGSETVHDVSNYSVQTLDQLIVKLVGDELALRTLR
jgi:Mg-chelatase subunit ChlD